MADFNRIGPLVSYCRNYEPICQQELTAGYDRTGAVQLLALMGFSGIFGSYLWGLIDQKIGTKKLLLFMLHGIWSGCCCYIHAKHSGHYLAVFMVGIGVGGICNLIPSYVGTIWKRELHQRIV